MVRWRNTPARPARSRKSYIEQGACHRAFGVWTFAPQLITTFLTLPFPPSSPSVYGRDFVFHEHKDGHIDLPWLVRLEYSNNVTAVDLDKPTIGHVDVPRLREGHVGGFFWCVRLHVAI